MADILQQCNSSSLSIEQRSMLTMSPCQKLLDPIADQENMEVNNEHSGEAITVWSPPNTPPNKFTFPKFPSLSEISPHDLNRLSDSKITPPRGRPKAEMINHLIVEGAQSCSPIRCDICSRVFPREKSLQAHRRTHSGDRPYTCDFPSCDKAFVQSGQLKTHQRLHTGEKPFICTVHDCSSRFTHANRHCPTHPKAGLVRKDCDVIPLKRALLCESQNKEPNEQTQDVLQWLDKYERERQDKSPGASKLKKAGRGDRDRGIKSQLSERRRSRIEARRRLAEQKERWFGALALVELAEITANIPVYSKSLNFPRSKFNHVELL